jgi:hypothetical protein
MTYQVIQITYQVIEQKPFSLKLQKLFWLLYVTQLEIDNLRILF